MWCLLAGGMIACVGFCLGVLAAAILAASDDVKFPPPAACTYPHGTCLATGRPGTPG